ncbi:MAG: 50S ribosomal protein L3 [Clostridiales bacterium]|nr:50S ribosomal protein L3 [Candidatus Apopatousia equi]
MKKVMLGKKLGMTQIFSDKGLVIPVTVVEAGPLAVIQKKTVEKDGYEALKVAFEQTRESLVNKPELGEFKKANVTPRKHVAEIKPDNISEYEVGSEIKCDVFSEGDIVDVSGTTRGRGFTGVIQRWNNARHRMTHGVSLVHRSVGSTGANSHVSRVMKGRRMPGHYGNEKVTIQNLQIVKVDAERNVLLIKGAVPGATGAILTIKSAVKAK